MATEDEYHRARVDLITQGTKSLLLISGGTAVALLSFLTTQWRTGEESLLLAILDGLVCVAISMVFAALHFFVRYKSSITFEAEGESTRQRGIKAVEWILILLSVVLYIASVFIVVSGAKETLSA